MNVKVHGRIPHELWAAADITGCSLISVDGRPRVEVTKKNELESETSEDHSFHEWVDILTKIKFRGEDV